MDRMIGNFVRSHDVYHDVVKSIVGMIADRMGYDVEFESKAEGNLIKNPHRPDLVLTYKGTDKTRKTKVYIEVQWDISVSWLDKMHEQYEGKDWCIIPLKRLVVRHTRSPKRFVESLYNAVEDYVITGTSRPPQENALHNNSKKPKKKRDKPEKVKKECEWCSKKVIDLYGHLRRCKYNPDNKKD